MTTIEIVRYDGSTDAITDASTWYIDEGGYLQISGDDGSLPIATYAPGAWRSVHQVQQAATAESDDTGFRFGLKVQSPKPDPDATALIDGVDAARTLRALADFVEDGPSGTRILA